MNESRWWGVHCVHNFWGRLIDDWWHNLGGHRVCSAQCAGLRSESSIVHSCGRELSLWYGSIWGHLPLLHLLLLQYIVVLRKYVAACLVSRHEGRHEACLLAHLLWCVIYGARVIVTGVVHRVLIISSVEVRCRSHIERELLRVKILMRPLLLLCLLPLNYLLLEHYRVYIASDLIIWDYCVLALGQQVCRVLHNLCWLSWLFDITFGRLFYRDNFCLGFLCCCGWLLGLLWLRLIRNFDFNFFKDRRVNFDLLRLFIGLLWCLYEKRFFFYNGNWFLFNSLFNADYTSELFNWFKLILIVFRLNQGVLVKICPQIITDL